jgi:hypothetical protein
MIVFALKLLCLRCSDSCFDQRRLPPWSASFAIEEGPTQGQPDCSQDEIELLNLNHRLAQGRAQETPLCIFTMAFS